MCGSSSTAPKAVFQSPSPQQGPAIISPVRLYRTQAQQDVCAAGNGVVGQAKWADHIGPPQRTAAAPFAAPARAHAALPPADDAHAGAVSTVTIEKRRRIACQRSG